jgi:hypothetical protein
MEWKLEFIWSGNWSLFGVETGVYLEWKLEFIWESGVTFGVIFGVFLESSVECFFFLILFKNVFCFIYKNSDYNLLPVEGII